MEKMSLTWQAPEYNHYERSTDWFWAVGIITVCIAVLAFIYNNALFGILILLSAGILVFYTFREPSMVDYEINQRGVIVGKDLHPYLTIESFWIETRQGEPKIILKSKKNLLPYIIIPIHEESVDEVANVLAEFLEEKELQEPAAHKIMEYLGF
ncbi:MAG: hypothetical protein WC027_00980 [Candidatus Paceibacterota bacterium]